MEDYSSTEIYRGRERQARVLADKAASSAIAAIHRAMAERYAELVEQATDDALY